MTHSFKSGSYSDQHFGKGLLSTGLQTEGFIPGMYADKIKPNLALRKHANAV